MIGEVSANKFLSVFYSIGSKPLEMWDKHVCNGRVYRMTDEEIQSYVLEILGQNISTTYITCPNAKKKSLAVKMPILVIVLKNLNKYFSFEVQILDDQNLKRRFHASTCQTATVVKPFACMMPMKLDEGWNQVQFDLADFTRRAYGTTYIETVKLSIHANCRLRRVYFCDRIYSEDELPRDYKLYLPLHPISSSSSRIHHHHHQQSRAITDGKTSSNR
ncbi:unnamed protein product [Schistosoma margrebowiei]|uniref:CFA20 domain-containing protein n=2 Tax=Schistosoma margrebowiei TaxID=48269 RepID=A0AA85AKF0_9TREM|nr:unnamed protein product [Schistosoma margrebowiei]